MFARFEARARARAKRRLAAHMEPDEQLLAVDLCSNAKNLDDLLSGRGRRVHVALSDRALYLVLRDGHVDRVPLTEIADVAFEAPPGPDATVVEKVSYEMGGALSRRVRFTLWDGTAVALLPVGKRAVATFGSELKARVPDRLVAEHRIEFGDGRGVTVKQRHGRPGSVGFDWDYSEDPGTDVRVESLRHRFDEEMHRLMREAGDPKARPE